MHRILKIENSLKIPNMGDG